MGIDFNKLTQNKTKIITDPTKIFDVLPDKNEKYVFSSFFRPLYEPVTGITYRRLYVNPSPPSFCEDQKYTVIFTQRSDSNKQHLEKATIFVYNGAT